MMTSFDPLPRENDRREFEFDELLQAVRAAATPEEQASADEVIPAIAAVIRSSRRPIQATTVREVASAGRRASIRLGAAIVVVVLTASTSLAISGQLPPGARDVAANFLARIGLPAPVPVLEASGEATAPHTTGQPLGPDDRVWLRLGIPSGFIHDGPSGSDASRDEPRSGQGPQPAGDQDPKPGGGQDPQSGSGQDQQPGSGQDPDSGTGQGPQPDTGQGPQP